MCKLSRVTHITQGAGQANRHSDRGPGLTVGTLLIHRVLTLILRGVDPKDVLKALLSVSIPHFDMDLSHFDGFPG